MLVMIYKQSLVQIVASQYNFERVAPMMDEFIQSADYWIFGKSYKYIWFLWKKDRVRIPQVKWVWGWYMNQIYF